MRTLRFEACPGPASVDGPAARVVPAAAAAASIVSTPAANGLAVRARHDGDGALTVLATEADAAPDRLREWSAGLAAFLFDNEVKALVWPRLESTAVATTVEQAEAIVAGLLLGSHDPGRWKSTGESRELVVFLEHADAEVSAAVTTTATVVGWTNWCRDLVNAPPAEASPGGIALTAADALCRLPGIRLQVLDDAKIRALGMGAFAAVAAGSPAGGRMIVVEYVPVAGGAGPEVLGLVGKAVTFDAGGISLKPALGLSDLRFDMAGGAAALAAIGAIAELEHPGRVIAVVPACENLPGPGAMRPGDVVTALDGTTIQITNTDYEGRLLLADALVYARRLGATRLVDIATLTDIAISLGEYHAGLFGNDPGWTEVVRQAGQATGDHVWPLPLNPYYRRMLDSPFADLRNYAERPSAMAGNLSEAETIQGATFLADFAGVDVPWAHIDIGAAAATAGGRETYLYPGATGVGVRLLTELSRTVGASSGAAGRE